MSDIRNIFQDSKNEQLEQIQQEAINFSCSLENFDFSESLSDVPIIYYVAGYICRQLIKSTKCKDCHELFSENQESLSVILEDNGLSEDDVLKGKAFVDAISRGGLTKPSNLLHVVCMHAWDLFRHIHSSVILKKELLVATNSRSVFVEAFICKLNEQECTHSLLSINCKSHHDFSTYIRRAAIAKFNMFAKNMVTEMNGVIHENRKREKPSKEQEKRDPTAVKSKKLKSNS